ncbi:MAG: membrane protein insertase YidC [Cyclobacteriaceae bacterium]
MDKNQAIGLLLSGLLLVIYFQFFAPEATPPVEDNPQEEQNEQPPSAQQSINDADEIPFEEADSLRLTQDRQKFGVFAPAARGESQMVEVETEDLLMNIDTRGGTIRQVVLKDYKDGEGNPLVLLDEESNTFSLMADTQQGNIDLYDLYYTTSASDVNVTAGDTAEFVLTARLEGGRQIRQVYSIPGSGFQLGYRLELDDAGSALASSNLLFLWNNQLKALEKNIDESRRSASLNYYTADGDLEKLESLMGDGAEEEEVEEPIKWIALKQRFFTSSIIADESFAQAKLETESPEEENVEIIKHMVAAVNMNLTDVNGGAIGYRYYFGPNNQQIMVDVAPDFEENINFGWPVVRWISKYPISYMFHWLEQFISNYGVIIIILVLVIKTILFPLSYKSYISMAKIKVLKPELDEIKEKHGDDMAKAQQEQMQLYQKVGVNPLSGCIPVVLQMPILLAMFNYFPNAIELRQESFLWADDLSTYDAIVSWDTYIPLVSDFYGNHVSLFVLLMTASTILYTWSNNQASTVQGPMKNLQYFLPVVFMFVLNSFPAALSFYYFVSNIVTFAQQAIIRKFVDDDKIRAILEENKKRNKNKKKSKFQMRLEEAMKASEETRKTPRENKGKNRGK